MSQFNISCVLSGNKWIYSFKGLNSDTVTLTNQVVLNGTSTFIDGNLAQTSNSTIVIVATNNPDDPALKVSGCATFEGNIQIILDQQPQDGNTSIILVSYNCTQQVGLSNSQVTITANYKDSNCDQIKSNVNDKPNTLSLSLSSSLNSKCKKGF